MRRRMRQWWCGAFAGRSPGVTTILLLGGTSLCTDISSEMTLTLAPIFLTGTLGVSVAAVGVIEGIGESTAALTRLWAGQLSDRLPRRRPLLLAGYSLSALSKPLFVLVAGPLLAGVLRFADRLGKGVRPAPRDALIADVTTAANRGLAFGVHRAADTAGAVLGLLGAALVVGLLASGDELGRGVFQRAVLVATVPAVIGVLLLTRLPREPRRASPGPRRRSLELPATVAERRYLGVVALFALGNSSDAFLVLRVIDVGASVVGVLLLLSAMNVVYALLSPVAGAWSDRFGRRRLLFWGYAAYALLYAGFAGAGSVAMAAPLVLLYGAYYGATAGVSRALLADLAPATGRGGSFGWFHMATGVAALPASVVAGALWTSIAPGAAFAFGSLCALAAAALMLTVPPVREGDQRAQARAAASPR